MRVSPGGVEFVGDLVTKVRVEEVLDPMGHFMQVIGRNIEMMRHVAFPETVGAYELAS